MQDDEDLTTNSTLAVKLSEFGVEFHQGKQLGEILVVVYTSQLLGVPFPDLDCEPGSVVVASGGPWG